MTTETTATKSAFTNMFNGVQRAFGIETEEPEGIFGKIGEWIPPLTVGALAHGRLVARPAIAANASPAVAAAIGNQNMLTRLSIGG